ncbi:hypothetical protein [Dictyobacter formicarum]|uniref:Haloacid dehalogenase n=1 Tax=Dictyobacter formicarum TaxID=2778368 RepID=A0ABQ3VDJ8_9CHLR|nr:hypothetical protein [Dictyobacter formicarum]GHO83738.1 hypothetical protein KSZ_17440 [Dictyobacter formicarum]
MSTYKCVFLDWAFTLSNSLFWEHLNNPEHEYFQAFQTIQHTLFTGKNISQLIPDWMRGKLTSEDIVAALCQQNTALDPQMLLAELELSCRQMQFVSPQVPTYVARLQARGIKVVIATDNMDTFTRWTVPALQLRSLFDDVLNSYDLQGLKADIDSTGRSVFFDAYLQDQQLRYGESVLIDDGDEEFGQVIRSFGIDYRHIQPRVGLVSELQKLLAALG